MKIKAILLLALVSFNFLFAQALKDPAVIIVPSTKWCKENGFIKDRVTPDYPSALQEENMQKLIFTLQSGFAENNFLTYSYNNEVEIDNPLIKMFTRINDINIANKDYVVELSLNGNEKDYMLKVRCYRNPSGEPIYIEEFKGNNLPEIQKSLGNNVNNIIDSILTDDKLAQETGLEGKVIFMTRKDSGFNFNSEIDLDGQKVKLSDYINNWFTENTSNKDSRNHIGKEGNTMSYNGFKYPYFMKSRGSDRKQNIYSFLRPLIKNIENSGLNVEIGNIGDTTLLVEIK